MLGSCVRIGAIDNRHTRSALTLHHEIFGRSAALLGAVHADTEYVAQIGRGGDDNGRTTLCRAAKRRDDLIA